MFYYTIYSIVGPAYLKDVNNFRRFEPPIFPDLNDILNREKEVKAYKF